MSYLLMLIYLCLKPYWPLFLAAGVGLGLTIYLGYKDLHIWTIVSATITSPLVVWCVYLVIRVMQEINRPW